MPSPRNRAENGPHTLTQVIAARNGIHRTRNSPAPLHMPCDHRGGRVATGQARLERSANATMFDGYATVYDRGYDMYGGPAAGGWTETVVRGAGAASLATRPDVVLLVNHAGLPLARTLSGTLTLTEDTHGLRNVAQLDLADIDVERLAVKMGRGDVTEQSFAFRILGQEWNADYTDRWITTYDLHRGDVSIVTYGANPATLANLT